MDDPAKNEHLFHDGEMDVADTQLLRSSQVVEFACLQDHLHVLGHLQLEDFLIVFFCSHTLYEFVAHLGFA